MEKKVQSKLFAMSAFALSSLVAYMLIFPEKVEHQQGIAALFLLSTLFVSASIRSPMKKTGSFFNKLLIVLALSVNFSCAFLLYVLIKLELMYLFVIVFVMSLLAGILTANTGRSILYTCLSIVIGFIIVVMLLSTPYLAYEETLVDIVILATIDALVRPLLFVMFFAFVGSTLGSLLGDTLR